MSYHTINTLYMQNNKMCFFDIFLRDNEIVIVCPANHDKNINHDKYSVTFPNNNNIIVKSKVIIKKTRGKYIVIIFSLSPVQHLNVLNVCFTYNDISANYNLTNGLNQNLFLGQTTLFKDDYKVAKMWINYYEAHGVNHFYVYYNEKLTTEIINFVKNNKANVTLLEWNFPYWQNGVPGNHFAQSGQMGHALYKYGKPYCKFMIFNDFDEFMKMEDINCTISDFLSNSNYDTIGFHNVWCYTIDRNIPTSFPTKIYKSTTTHKFGYRSK